MMPATMQFELDAAFTEEVNELAAVLHKTPEQIAKEIFADGLHKLRRMRFYSENAGTVTPEEGLAILWSAGKGNPPDPGDELPDDLKYLLDERRP